MATTKTLSKVDLKISVNLEITPEEATVLNIITLWGVDAFMDTFAKSLGSDLKDKKQAVSSLFDGIKKNLPSTLKEIDSIQKKVKLLNNV